MAHRNFQYLALSILILSLLQGCGFHLRGNADLPPSISPLYIEGLGDYDPLRKVLRQTLTDANVQVTDSRSQARSILQLRNQDQDRRVLSVDGSGKVVEYELHQALDFDLMGADGNTLVEEQAVGTQRAYINTESELLGKAEEESDVRDDMRRDLASRIVSRLQIQLQGTSHK